MNLTQKSVSYLEQNKYLLKSKLLHMELEGIFHFFKDSHAQDLQSQIFICHINVETRIIIFLN